MKISDLWVKLSLKKDGFDSGIDNAKKKTSAFGSAVKKIGGLVAGAFAVQSIAKFGAELVKLGGEAEGVESAFNRIADSKTLQDLKNSVRGTVSELELMKRAVSAQNLGLPVENLASLFEFATKRAQDTGESVDYLVNSIVTGIGRKSPLILDNLGISAIQLREKLHGVGLESASVGDVTKAVGEIAAESMRRSGDIIDTNAIKVQRLGAAWEDFQKKIATNTTVLNYFSEQLEGAEIMATILTSDQISGWEKLRSTLFDNKEEAKKLADELERTAKINKGGLGFADGPQPFKKTADDLDNLIPRWEEQATYVDALKSVLKDTKADLDALMKAGGKWHGQSSAEDFIGRVDELRGKIEETEKAIKKATFTRADTSMLAEISSIGTSQSELASLMPDLSVDTSMLDPLDDFIQKYRDKLANLIDEETMSKMKANFDKVEEANMAFTSALESAIIGAFTQLGTAIGESLTGGGWTSFGDALLGIIGSFMTTLGGAIIAIGVGLLNLEAGLLTANPVAVIAAGIALTAAGAALSSIVSGGITGGGGTGASSAYSMSSSASQAISGDVRFVLEGDKLVGAIDGNKRRRSITG